MVLYRHNMLTHIDMHTMHMGMSIQPDMGILAQFYRPGLGVHWPSASQRPKGRKSDLVEHNLIQAIYPSTAAQGGGGSFRLGNL